MNKKIVYVVLLLCIIMTGCSSEKESEIDYMSYQNKIWIDANEPIEESSRDKFSFVITKMESDYVEGQYVLEDTVINPQKDLPGRFTGKIVGAEMQCQLLYDGKEAGSMVLQCVSDSRLNAEIHYEGTDKTLTFKVYNIEDFIPTNIILDQNRAVTTQFDKWGMVQIIRGIKYPDDRGPVAYIVNEQGDILYEFCAEFEMGTIIKEIKMQDFDEDGLKDVEIVTNDYDDEQEPVHWIFYQEEGATFYIDNEAQSSLFSGQPDIVPIKKR